MQTKVTASSLLVILVHEKLATVGQAEAVGILPESPRMLRINVAINSEALCSSIVGHPTLGPCQSLLYALGKLRPWSGSLWFYSAHSHC